MIGMEKRELIDGLGKIEEFFAARADMAIGDGKMLLLNWSKCAQEAATILKAQEPRVMDVTEVSACEVGTVLWVEERQGVTWNLFPLELETSSTHPDTGTDYVFFITYHDIRKLERSEYNQTWRCWNSRPDEKRRAETPWN